MANKYNNRHNKHKAPIIHWLPTISKIFAILIALGFIIWTASKSNSLRFLEATIHWHIDNTLPITQATLMDKIQPFIKDKYLLNLQQIKTTLEAEPWVSEVHINRLLWNAIKIKVVTKNIAMRWKNTHCRSKKLTHCSGYISSKGRIFMPTKLVPSNAVLALSKPDKNSVAKLYQDYQHYQTIAKPLGIQSFSRTHIDQLTFTAGVKVILGHQKQTKRLQRFILAYNKLKKTNLKVAKATFDMRYPKGFALSY